MKYKKPNFIIVGGARCGTTSLYQYLRQHPDVFFPKIKEPRFFVKNHLDNIDKKDPSYRALMSSSFINEVEYFNLFNSTNSYKVYGEASVHYLYNFKESISSIKNYLGDIPIIILIRNPIFRAISNWAFNGSDTNDFKTSFNNDDYYKNTQFNSFWYYKSQGFYYDQVNSFISNFTKVKVIVFEDFIENLKYTMDDLCHFLNIDNFSFNFKKIYSASNTLIPRNKFIYKMYKFQLLRKMLIKSIDFIFSNKLPYHLVLKRKELIDVDIIKECNKYYLEEIQKLEELLKRDLNIWK